MWFFLLPLLIWADDAPQCASGIFQKPFLEQNLELANYTDEEHQVGVVCSMTFIYRTGYCTRKTGKRVGAIVSRYAHLPPQQITEDFCVIGEHSTTCFCRETGCNTNVRIIINIFNSNLNRRKEWMTRYHKYNRVFVPPNETDVEDLDDCLFNEFPVRWSEGEDKYTIKNGNDRKKKTNGDEQGKIEDDSFVFQVTIVGGIVPLIMLIMAYGLFNSMESKRKNTKLRYRDSSEPMGEEGTGTIVAEGKASASAEDDAPRSREEAPRSREEAPRSREEAPRPRDDVSRGGQSRDETVPTIPGYHDQPAPRPPPPPAPPPPPPEEDGYESVDPTGLGPPPPGPPAAKPKPPPKKSLIPKFTKQKPPPKGVAAQKGKKKTKEVRPKGRAPPKTGSDLKKQSRAPPKRRR